MPRTSLEAVVSTGFEDKELPADPLDAPPVPYRMSQDPQRFRYAHPTPPRAAFRPYLDETPELLAGAVELSEHDEPRPVVRTRIPVPPAIPEGHFNPGVAIAWTVALGMSAVVFLWHSGAALILGR